jgi:sigma-B regulation protein RsbU (phosphoserine phosphatase)
MVTAIEPLLREQLLSRRHKLEHATETIQNTSELQRLLTEVDTALNKMETGSYGLCELCHETVEAERLIANPLTRFCLDHLTPSEQRELEEDLELASTIQNGLLPEPSRKIDGWEIAFHYEPARLVSGDYCDLIESGKDALHFVLGDVSGKGVAASMLMAHLQAMFRTLVASKLPLDQMVARASRVFCESTLPTHYATLVCGRANRDGEVEICNAGHLPPLFISQGEVSAIEATGLPVGVFCNERFTLARLSLQKGDTIFLYTDGLSEMTNAAGSEYGADRLKTLLTENHSLSARGLLELCVSEAHEFRQGRPIRDDLTLMAIQRVD